MNGCSDFSASRSLIRVGLVGAGCMGRGIALQIQATPGMNLVWVADQNLEVAQEVAKLSPGAKAHQEVSFLMKEEPIDVFVEATNSIGSAAEYCLQAIDSGAHVVLMNAEVDLALGPLLTHRAHKKGVVVTSDAGDQHGVLATMIEEAQWMGFDVVQAGNIKGFLDQSATPESLVQEAAKRRLSPTQCCAYTDGTKLHIEMAVLANAKSYQPPEGGMTGPRATRVEEALTVFDFDAYGQTPRVEYILGAEPGGGVYLVVKPKEELPEEQAFYLNYYKLNTSPCGKYYLLYRPYHLCHLETPKAIFKAFQGKAVLSTCSQTCDVYAYAKKDLAAGDRLCHAIGSAEVYGILEPLNEEKIPIALLEDEVYLKKAVASQDALSFDCCDLPDNTLTRLWNEQKALCGCCPE